MFLVLNLGIFCNRLRSNLLVLFESFTPVFQHRMDMPAYPRPVSSTNSLTSIPSQQDFFCSHDYGFSRYHFLKISFHFNMSFGWAVPDVLSGAFRFWQGASRNGRRPGPYWVIKPSAMGALSTQVSLTGRLCSLKTIISAIFSIQMQHPPFRSPRRNPYCFSM